MRRIRPVRSARRPAWALALGLGVIGAGAAETRGQTPSGSGAPATQKAGAPTTRAAPKPTGKAAQTPKAGTTTPQNQNGTTQNQKTSGNTPATNSQGAGTQGANTQNANTKGTNASSPDTSATFPFGSPKAFGLEILPQTGNISVGQTALQNFGPNSGFQVNDQITGVNGVPVTTPQAFLQQLATTSGNGFANVQVMRAGSAGTVRVDALGLGYGFQLGNQSGTAQISQIRADSVAASAGLRVGDQVVSINGESVSSDSSLRSQLGKLRDSKDPASLRVRRNGNIQTLRLPTAGSSAANAGGASGNSSLGSLATQAAGKLGNLSTALKPLVQQLGQLGPAAEKIGSQLDQLASGLGDLGSSNPQDAQQKITAARQALRSLRSELDRLASQAEPAQQKQLEQLRSGLLGMGTDLDTLSTAARRSATSSGRSGGQSLKSNITQASGTIGSIRDELNTLAKNQTGQTRQELERISSQLERLGVDLNGLASGRAGNLQGNLSTARQLLKSLGKVLEGLGPDVASELKDLLPRLVDELDMLGTAGSGQPIVVPQGDRPAQPGAIIQQNPATPNSSDNSAPVSPLQPQPAADRPAGQRGSPTEQPEPRQKEMTLEQWLGTETLGMSLTSEAGTLQVSGVARNGFAAEVGFRPGDEVRAVDGTQVTTPEQFYGQLGTAAQNNGIAEVSIQRKGQPQTPRLDLLGLRTGLHFTHQNKVDGNPARPGVGLSDVKADSVGADAGLRAGDQLVSLNGQPVSSSTNLRSGLSTAIRKAAEVTLGVRRDGVLQDVRLDFRAGQTRKSRLSAGR